MLQLSPVPATPYVEQLSIGAGRRTLAISLAIAITGLLLLMLLTFGPEEPPESQEKHISVVSIEAPGMPEEASESSSPEREQSEEQPEQPQPPTQETQPAEPLPRPPVESKATPTVVTPDQPAASPAIPKAVIRPSSGRAYGPPDRRGSSASRDTERVGTAPNGEPLYAASWYREPSNDELRGYLSTASGPGWGLIACRTVPDYRVEDCVALDEYPTGSQINRAVLAASWAFRVRPPRLGGQPMVGSWVRIRIDYDVKRR